MEGKRHQHSGVFSPGKAGMELRRVDGSLGGQTQGSKHTDPLLASWVYSLLAGVCLSTDFSPGLGACQVLACFLMLLLLSLHHLLSGFQLMTFSYKLGCSDTGGTSKP